MGAISGRFALGAMSGKDGLEKKGAGLEKSRPGRKNLEVGDES